MGRPKKASEVEPVEYKNVTENELMIFEIFGDEEEKHMVKIKPNETVYLTEKDLKNHKNDLRFLQGRIVPVGSDQEVSLTNEANDTMTELQIEYFIKNTETATTLSEKIAPLKSVHTVGRLLKEAKKPEHMKTYEFVSILEQKFHELVVEQDKFLGKVEKE
jgi:hypothetical protein